MALDRKEIKDELKRTAKCEAVGIGAIIKNRYQIVAYLGRGGMSTVYKALDMSTGRTVALKILHSELLADSTRVQRFAQEAKTYRNLRHDHIVKTYEFFTDEYDRHCLVMEYHEGRNLSEVLSDQGRLSIRRAIKVFSEICAGLDHAHSQGIVHRDLKPSNIALVEKENDVDFVKVLDFGIAKLMPTDSETQLGLTQTGEIVGSPLYMSPEQCMAKPIDHRSDIYSLGCLMYEALTGEPPLMGGNVYETFHMQTHDRPKPLGEVRPEFKGGTQFEYIILKCMAKNPRHRYQTMNEVIDALEHVGSYSSPSGLGKVFETLKQNRIRNRAKKGKGVSAVIAALVTAIVIIGAGFLFQDRIRQIVIPADQRFNTAIVQYRKAFDSGNYEIAEQEGLKALKVAEEERKQWLVPAFTNLIDLYRITGRVKEAETLNARVKKLSGANLKTIEKNERKLFGKLKTAIENGSEDVEQIEDFCFQLSDLANTCIDNQQFDDAKKILKRTLQAAEKSIGEKNLVVAGLVDNLALLRLKNNLDEDYVAIEEELANAVEKRQEIAGGESTGLIRTLEALSEAQRRQGKLEEARENALKALSIARNAFRSTSSQAAVTKCQVAEIELAREKPSNALSAASTALASMDQMKESDDLEQARCRILLAEAKKMSDQKSQIVMKELEIARESLKEGADSQVLLLARAMSDMADIYTEQAKQLQKPELLKLAEGHYKRALALMFRSPAREEVRVLAILDNLSNIYQQQSRTQDALVLYKIIEQVDKSTGKTKGLIEDNRLIAQYYREQRDYKEAARSLEEALSLSRRFYGSQSMETCKLLGLIGEIYMKDKKFGKAGPLLEEAAQILKAKQEAQVHVSRKDRMQVLSAYSSYLEKTRDTEKLQEVKAELNSI